jgi:hypothetical protein
MQRLKVGYLFSRLIPSVSHGRRIGRFRCYNSLHKNKKYYFRLIFNTRLLFKGFTSAVASLFWWEINANADKPDQRRHQRRFLLSLAFKCNIQFRYGNKESRSNHRLAICKRVIPRNEERKTRGWPEGMSNEHHR